MRVEVWKSTKQKEDPMAKALQVMQMGSFGSDMMSKGAKAGPQPSSAGLIDPVAGMNTKTNPTPNTMVASNDTPDTQDTSTSAPNPVSGTNNKSSAMSRRYRSYTA